MRHVDDAADGAVADADRELPSVLPRLGAQAEQEAQPRGVAEDELAQVEQDADAGAQRLLNGAAESPAEARSAPSARRTTPEGERSATVANRSGMGTHAATLPRWSAGCVARRRAACLGCRTPTRRASARAGLDSVLPYRVRSAKAGGDRILGCTAADRPVGGGARRSRPTSSRRSMCPRRGTPARRFVLSPRPGAGGAEQAAGVEVDAGRAAAPVLWGRARGARAGLLGGSGESTAPSTTWRGG